MMQIQIVFCLFSLTLVFVTSLKFGPSIRCIHKLKDYRNVLSLRSTVESTPAVSTDIERAVYITENAMKQLKSLQSKKIGESNVLRMGVKAGGCSGMSYSMDFVSESTITDDDYVEEFDDSLRCVIDPKSMLYLFGLHLDYSDELIGGGFKFTNPNAESSCGCGKSFGV